MVTLIDGKAASKKLRVELAREVETLAQGDQHVALAVVRVGDDPASEVYVRNKRRACARAGIRAVEHHLPGDTSQPALETLVDGLNEDPEVHGVLVQLPLPAHLDEAAVIDRILPQKDVDGFHPDNMGRLALGRPRYVPCTALGVLHLLKHYEVVIAGQRAVVVGRSQIVGKPVAALLTRENATVTLCHSKTRALDREVAEADILVAALGRPEFIRGDWIRPGATVIDVGINRLPDGRLVGDVEFATASSRAGAITPVPGGVGPMTVAFLMHNTIMAAKAATLRHRAPV